MQYRKFGRLDWKASALGFGAMRLPIIEKRFVQDRGARGHPNVTLCHRSGSQLRRYCLPIP